MKMHRLAAFGLVLFCVVSYALAASNPSYKVIKTYKIGGEGGWDYLTFDNSTHYLYISRATHMVVLDTDSGKQVGEIADTPGVHGIALVPELGRGFTSNGRENTVSVVDTKTFKTLSKIKVGDNPDAILYDPATNRIFTFNGRSHDSTAIDPEKATVIGTIPLEGKPEFAVSDGKGGVFVNIEDKNQIDSIDPRALQVKARWPMAGCEGPTGLSMDRKNQRLFSGCDKMMAIVDANSGKLVSHLPICDGVDGTAFDEETNLAFASCHDGKLTVVKEDSADQFSVVENATTQEGARTLALDPKTHNVFTVTARFGPAPPPSAQNAHPRPTILPDSFVVLVLGKQ
jgi:YVTN family beta-propeller protein